MGRRALNQRMLRKITKNNSGSYSISLPIELIRELGWLKGQNVAVHRQGKKLVIES